MESGTCSELEVVEISVVILSLVPLPFVLVQRFDWNRLTVLCVVRRFEEFPDGEPGTGQVIGDGDPDE